MPELKEIYNQHKDQLRVIYLNNNNEKEEVRQFIKEHQLLNWVNGFANESIEKEFLLNGYPYGVLFDKNGKVIKFDCKTRHLEQFLENQKNETD